MSFTPRTYTSIIVDMIAYVQEHTTLTDFEVGSVVRTFLEAAALEDDEQYFQMVQLLDIFSYVNAVGSDLDRRLADFNIFREPATEAFGKVAFKNKNLPKDLVSVDASASAVLVSVFDSSPFPGTGPYVIRISEGTSRAQDYTVASLDTPSNTFTLSAPTPLVTDIEVGDRVSLVTGTPSYPINAGTAIQAPPTVSEVSKLYNTTEIATIASGNFYSNEVTAVSTSSGPGGNTGSGRITQFTGNPSFTGAGVTNFKAFEGGRATESDQSFRNRAVEKLQSLSKGTVLALKAQSVGITDATTGQRVISSNVLEDFAAVPDEVIVYIDDGTGLVPDRVILAQNTLSGAIGSGTTLPLNDTSSFPSSGFVLVTRLVSTVEVGFFFSEYVSKTDTSLELSTTIGVSLLGGDLARKVDVASFATESGQRRFSLQHSPIVRSSISILFKDPTSAAWERLIDNTDFVLNKGTGEFSIVSFLGFAVGTQVVAHYTYYTNLVAETQKVLEGSSGDSVNYPGVKAAGVFLAVEAPTFKRVTIRVTISAETGFVESELVPQVTQEIETYIRSLKIGEDVIVSRIVDVSHNVTGVRSVIVQLPTTDLVVLENELPVSFDSSQNSLVTVL